MFLDELNTSSCMGLFKEMIVDKSFEGEVSVLYKPLEQLIKVWKFIATTIQHIPGSSL